MKKTLTILSVLLLSVAILFVSCSKKEESSTSKDGSDVIKLALIVENTVDDKGWCQSMHEGILEAQELLPGRIEYSYSEKMLPVDAGSAVRNYVSDGYDVIITHGTQYKNIVSEVSSEYPEVTFVLGTSSEIGPANLFTYDAESEETGYLSGLIAGMLTKSNIVGIVGPVDGGDSARYNRGYVLGVQKVNPNAKILVAHSGSYSDFVKAGEIATNQLLNGADVVSGSAQQSIGALRAVAENPDALWVGQDLAQLTTAEGKAKCVAASSYNYASVITTLVAKLDAGIKGGECLPLNFNNGGFIFDYNPALESVVTDEIRKTVEDALSTFRTTPNTLSNWSEVDYTKL